MITFLISSAIFMIINMSLTLAFRAGFRDDLQFILEDAFETLTTLFGDRQ